MPSGLEVIIVILCGNDFLGGSSSVRSYSREWDVAAAALCAEMKKKSRRQFGVIGASSATWQYSHAKHINDRYDANANRLAATFMRCGVPSCTGSAELQDLDSPTALVT